MAEISVAIASRSEEQIPQRVLLAGIALCSFSALLLELALTRLFSVVLFYHFAFLAISIALLGLGAGGVFAYLAKNWLRRFSTRRLVSSLCAINAILIPIVLEVVLHVPVSLDLTTSSTPRACCVTDHGWNSRAGTPSHA